MTVHTFIDLGWAFLLGVFLTLVVVLWYYSNEDPPAPRG
jgi:hypothetical protein